MKKLHRTSRIVALLLLAAVATQLQAEIFLDMEGIGTPVSQTLAKPSQNPPGLVPGMNASDT